MRSAVGWQPVAGTTGLSGTVLDIGTFEPVSAAQLALTSLSDPKSAVTPRTKISDASGAIKVDSILPGKYLLTMRRIGYRPVSDTVLLPPDSALIVRAMMARETAMLDGCGYAYYEKRVPWWIRK
jgi:hypothetical protein